jgi:hypothetical protein
MPFDLIRELGRRRRERWPRREMRKYLWNRQLAKPMPREVVLVLDQNEKNLDPFCDDLEKHF